MAKMSNKPSIHMPRSRFDLSYKYMSMFDLGTAVPFLLQEVYPGDSFKVNSNFVIRTSTPFIRPIMDNLFADVYYFFVPSRLCYDHWQEIMGENKSSYWEQTNHYEVPVVSVPLNGKIDVGTIADYFGLPTNITFTSSGTGKFGGLNVMPFRANALIYNEWFRNENIQAPVYVNTGDYSTNPQLNNQAWDVNNIFGKQFKINKLKDYFTACLPEPQKGDPVSVPLGDAAPVGSVNKEAYDFSNLFHTGDSSSGTPNPVWMRGIGGSSSNGPWTVNSYAMSTNSTYDSYVPSNLVARLDSVLNPANVNDLRFAFAMQRALEKDARGGTRYIEYLYNHFGVISPDARLQRPEFLGGHRSPLNVSQVTQTAPNQTSGTSDATSYLAQVSGYSLSNGRAGFNKGFVEHGYIIGYIAVRQHHTYQGGISKMWTRKSRYDFYDPVFSFIGEQPVYKYELYGQHYTEKYKDVVFGYNESFADLRFNFNKVTGALSSNANQGFDIWHLGDDFGSTVPSLNDAFVKESPANIDRCLSVGSSTAPNFILDAWHDIKAVRVLPTFGTPGLIDHM